MNSASSRTLLSSCRPTDQGERKASLWIAARLGVAAAVAVLLAGLATVPAGSNENGASAFDILPDAPARLLIEGRYADDMPFRISPIEDFAVTPPRHAGGMNATTPSH
jgi:hypothetical protein